MSGKIQCKGFARSIVTPLSSGGINTNITNPTLSSFLQIIEHFYSNHNFVLLILLVHWHLSGTISIKKIGHYEATSYYTSVFKY